MLDTNILLAAEPFDGHLEATIERAALLLRLANEQGHLLCVAAATRQDMLEGRDVHRRDQRLAELGKFHELDEVPLDPGFIALIGASRPGSNDHRDLRILATLNAGAAGYLVSNDLGLRRRARRAGLGDAVLSLAEAVLLLEGLAPRVLVEPPRVSRPKCYTLDSHQQIFDGLRTDYPGFDSWLDTVKRQSDDRVCFLVTDAGTYAAIALLKAEHECAYPLDQPVLKVSTFKVADTHAGSKFGELLLKAIMQHTQAADAATLYVEVLDTHQEVVDFLTTFGFADEPDPSKPGQHVMVKRLKPDSSAADLSDLEYHIRYGPSALRPTQSMFIIPIKPIWHDQLFPEKKPIVAPDAQLSLFSAQPITTHPWGNAIRKAYLCNSSNASIKSGDLLLFYRSQDVQAASTIGIVEKTLRSRDPVQVMTFVGQRTVYRPHEISELAAHRRGVLAIRFRQDRFLDPAVTLNEMQIAGVLQSWPQSITKLKKAGETWLKNLLDV